MQYPLIVSPVIIVTSIIAVHIYKVLIDFTPHILSPDPANPEAIPERFWCPNFTILKFVVQHLPLVITVTVKPKKMQILWNIKRRQAL